MIINPRWINPYLRHRRRVSAHLWSIITLTLILSESAFGEEFPSCWAPLIMSHDCTKTTNQSLSSWCREKSFNIQFLLCVSICCCCVLRCTFDAAINLPSHPVLQQMLTLTQGWLDFGGHDSWSRSLQPRVPHTLSIDFIFDFFGWNVKCEAIGFLCWFSLSDTSGILFIKCGANWHFGSRMETLEATAHYCGWNRGKEFIDIMWQFLISINSETERDLFCCSGGASRPDEPQQHASSRSGASPYKQALIMGWSVAAGGKEDRGERRWLTRGRGWWWSAQQERRASVQLLVKWLRFW